MKKTKNQSGSTLILALVVITVGVLLGVGGVFAFNQWQQMQSPKDTSTPITVQSNESPESTTKPENVPTPTPTPIESETDLDKVEKELNSTDVNFDSSLGY